MPEFLAPDYWLVGTRMYFKRDGQSGTLDLGTITDVQSNFETNTATLDDAGETGRLVRVDERVRSIDESYELTMRDFNPQNKAILFLANPPEEVTQSAASFDVAHTAVPGLFLKLVDGSGTPVFGVSQVAGLYTGAVTRTVDGLTTINRGTRTLTFAAPPGVVADDLIIVDVAGLANPLNAGTYKVVSVSGNNVVVSRSPASDETAVTVDWIKENGGTIYEPEVDYRVVNRARGMVLMAKDGALATEGTVQVVYGLQSQTQTKFSPQSQLGSVKGEAMLFFTRDGGGNQTVRRARVSLAPSGLGLSAEEHSSWTLTASVLSDTSGITGQNVGELLDFRDALAD